MKSLPLLLLFLVAACDTERETVAPTAPPVTEQPPDEDAEIQRAIEVMLAEFRCNIWHSQAELWKKENGHYPPSFEAMTEPFIPGTPPLEIKDDPWGNAYVYEVKDGKVLVTSFGPDGRRGTADDITSDDE